MYVYKAHAEEDQRQRELCGSGKSMLPCGAVAALRLSPTDTAQSMIGPTWAGPTVVAK